MRRNQKGQSTAEYAVVFAVVLAALIGMQIYVKRGMNARLKDASDSTVETLRAELELTGQRTDTDIQYEPYYASSTYNVTQDSSRKDIVELGGVVKKDNIVEVTERTGSQSTGAATQD